MGRVPGFVASQGNPKGLPDQSRLCSYFPTLTNAMFSPEESYRQKYQQALHLKLVHRFKGMCTELLVLKTVNMAFLLGFIDFLVIVFKVLFEGKG